MHLVILSTHIFIFNKVFFLIFRLHNKGVYFRAGLKKMVKGYSKTFVDEVEIEVIFHSLTFLLSQLLYHVEGKVQFNLQQAFYMSHHLYKNKNSPYETSQ